MTTPIRTALISVYHKDGIDAIAQILHQHGVTIYSTGGTLAYIRAQGIPATAVEELTGSPEILGGRVKTLHPKIFGGILARRDDPTHLVQLAQHEIPTIDLVIVDLYPFEATVAAGGSEPEAIEQIDIGGISLLRAAAKNYRDTLVVSSCEQYTAIAALLARGQCQTILAERRQYAAQAFMATSHYDMQIFKYYNRTAGIPAFKQSYHQSEALRYGENPHQQGTYYGDLSACWDMLHGKPLSYNNLVDVAAALEVIGEFDEPTFAIIKHTNTCGLASRDILADAYRAALAADPVSAFGGVLACNRRVDIATAELVHVLFCEVIAAPDYEPAALALLQQKKNRIILRTKSYQPATKTYRSLLNGVLEQDADLHTESVDALKTVTKRAPTSTELDDMVYALIAVKHLKSNGIAIVKNKQLIGMGCGQTSRVEALESAIKKAKAFGLDTKGAVMASEAFFPFADCVEIAHAAGITAIAQPGGSIKDADSIAAADAHGQAMVVTGFRHFKH
jgi:phosphoribosylaminoimidazolecarboxamide formyltransferase / IMP cyclohydrolase